ncbi:MAG: hypothetical protein K6C36_04600 [Clostridia bacterium]|nr:hypothetical protein [Clostridia bacterium]
MEKIVLAIKAVMVLLFIFNVRFPQTGPGAEFGLSPDPEPGDENCYIQIKAVDTGLDTWQPSRAHGGYRYGPSMILNADGSLDVWSASDGPGDVVDIVDYKRLYDGGKSRTKEVTALEPSPAGYDEHWACDPGVIKLGEYYYIGYTTTLDYRGVNNVVCVGRSKNPAGPFTEKWNGEGWGVDPVPIIEYDGDPEAFGVGEPSFVRLGDTLYIYYSWCEAAATTRVAVADATDENWPATIELKGECIPAKDGGDSADVKYVDEYGRFVAVFTEKRFSDDSRVSVWESFDGLSFRPAGFIKANTAKKLHNCGISGRADGHIGAGDKVYLSYAYGSNWGNWSTRLQEVKLSLSETAELDDSAEENVEIKTSSRLKSLVPEILMIKAERRVYDVTDSEKIRVIAFDTDRDCFEILSGAEFYGYDESVISVDGTRVTAVGAGSTNVFISWRGYNGVFRVNVPG